MIYRTNTQRRTELEKIDEQMRVLSNLTNSGLTYPQYREIAKSLMTLKQAILAEITEDEKSLADIYQLTELEQRVLREALSEGFAYDGGNENFLCWGFEGKRERGAVSSLIKKGILIVEKVDNDTMVFCGEGISLGDIEELAGKKRTLA